MVTLGKKIVKYRVPILVVCLLLMIPSVLGMLHTRINYDMLDYLPGNMDTVQGQNILLEDFGKGGFSLVMVEGMPTKDVAALKARIQAVEHVESVLWYDSLLDVTVPLELLPQKYYEAFNRSDATMMAVFFDTSTSADETMGAIQEIRGLAGKQCFISGLSAMVTDLKALCEREEPIYVGLAVLLACAAMMLFLESWLLPLLFLVSIGMAILYNLGSNYFLGEISYITKALSAVLQLGVTMDYSIFLWHSYSEQKERIPGDKAQAMAQAIANTITSIVGSSVTTVAGFIALCFMSFTLGADLGIVMAKGVVLGVIGCVTTLPALILIFDRAIERTRHRPLLPKMDRIANLLTKRSWISLIAFVVILMPALFGYTNAGKYYDLSLALPQDLDYAVANAKLQDDFGLASTHMILADAQLPPKETKAMMAEMEAVDGVRFVLGVDSVVGSAVPAEALPKPLTQQLRGDRYQLMLVSSQYKVASDEVNAQVATLNDILKKYDQTGMLIGEAPCTKDLITVTDHDFQVVNVISIAAIFLIIALVLKSALLPVILVSVIEFAIFINLGIPYYTNTALPFVAPICISTIQLGATVDYAILMTTRYKRERFSGKGKREAVNIALATSIPSIVVSALGFFASTFGVGLYSDIDMISSMCLLMSRGAIISMLCVILVLPAMFMAFDRAIMKTSLGPRKQKPAQQAAM